MCPPKYRAKIKLVLLLEDVVIIYQNQAEFFQIDDVFKEDYGSFNKAWYVTVVYLVREGLGVGMEGCCSFFFCTMFFILAFLSTDMSFIDLNQTRTESEVRLEERSHLRLRQLKIRPMIRTFVTLLIFIPFVFNLSLLIPQMATKNHGCNSPINWYIAADIAHSFFMA